MASSDFLSLNPGSLIQKMTPDMEDRGNLARTLQHLALVAQEVFITDMCVISALHPITRAALFSFQVSEENSNGALQSAEEFALEALLPELLQQNMLMVSNLNAMPGHQNDFTLSKGIQAFVALALRIRPESPPFGALYLAFREPHTFSPESYELLQFFTHQASFVLQETWLLHRYREVARIGQEINDELSTIEALFHKLCALTIDILDARHALLLIIRKTPGLTSDLYLMDESEIIKHMQRPPIGAYRYAIDRQEPLLIQHWSEEAAGLPFQIAHIPGSRPKESYIFVPLILHGIALGVLSIQHIEPCAYTREDLAVLQVLANHTALAINNIRLYHSLTQLNETGQLFTRRIDPVYPLRTTVDRIQAATEADLVVLYPMPAFQANMLSALLTAGDWRQPQTSPELFDECLRKIGSALLTHTELLFASEISDLPISLPARAAQELHREEIVSLVMIPLRVETEEIGILCLFFRQHQYFDAPQKLLIEGLASYTAIAFRNARTFDTATQRHLRELEALQTIDRELNQSLELEPVLDTILRLACESVPAEGASVLLYNPDTRALDARFIHGNFAPTWRYPSRTSRGIVWWVLEHKQSVRIGNVHTDPIWRKRYVSTIRETTSELDVPLLDGEEAVGVLNFESSKENAFSKEDLDFLQTLAGQAILAIKKAQAYEREKRLADDRQTLFDISKELTSQLVDSNRVFDLILQKALELTRSETGVLMLHHPGQHRLTMTAESGVIPDKKGHAHSVDEGIVGYAVREKRILNIDPSLPQWQSFYLDYIPGTHSELVVPMIADGEVRGVINIESKKVNAFNESDQRLLQGLADLAVIALRNTELYQQAEKETQHFALLYQASKELGRISDMSQLQQIYEVILTLAEKYSHSNVVLRRYDEANDELVLVRASSRKPEPFHEKEEAREGMNGYVTQHHETCVVYDTAQPPDDLDTSKLLQLQIRSAIVVPVRFEERDYGTLGLCHTQPSYFRGTDIQFYEGLAQQLAGTIYRLEAVEARLESEQRARAAEEVALIGQSAMELTHRLGNDLGLVESQVSEISRRLSNRGINDSGISRKLENIVKSVRRVLDLSRGLKRLLASSNETAEHERVQISPLALLQNACATHEIPSTIHVQVNGDPDVSDILVNVKLIDDILQNLIANALDAMPEGGVLTLHAYMNTNNVALEVKDTGPGIPLEKQTKIFTLFYSTKGSSGFGLWSARRNALRNNGDLRVESRPGSGSTFTLLLPRL